MSAYTEISLSKDIVGAELILRFMFGWRKGFLAEQWRWEERISPSVRGFAEKSGLENKSERVQWLSPDCAQRGEENTINTENVRVR